MTHPAQLAPRATRMLEEVFNASNRIDRVQALDAAIRLLKAELREEVSRSRLAAPSPQESYVTEVYRAIMAIESPNERTGKLLTFLRRWRGRHTPLGELRVTDIAAGIGVASSSLHNWEAGRTGISLWDAARWCNYANVPLGILDTVRPVDRLEVRHSVPTPIDEERSRQRLLDLIADLESRSSLRSIDSCSCTHNAESVEGAILF